MDNIYIVSALISVSYLIFKFAEMRILEKENKPIKDLVKDALMVYISVVVGFYILSQFGQKIIKSAPKVFTDNPGF